MATHYRRCAGITRKGDICRNSGNCPHHRAANADRRREDDDQQMASVRKVNEKAKRNAMPQTLFTRERIAELIALGYAQEAEQNRRSAPCGCEG